MFLNKLFRKKRDEQHKVEQEKSTVTVERNLEGIDQLGKKLQGEQDVNQQIQLLNKIGDLYFEIDYLDQAIEHWETSIQKVARPGHAQAQLLKAYNQKRRISLQNKDDVQAEKYLKKIDELMQFTKDAIRYGQN